MVGRSCWDYFHPQEIPFAKARHGRGIELDKAAALFYCKVKHRDGSFVSCECVFTVVYDVLVASTSIYRQSTRSLRKSSLGNASRLTHSCQNVKKKLPWCKDCFPLRLEILAIICYHTYQANFQKPPLPPHMNQEQRSFSIALLEPPPSCTLPTAYPASWGFGQIN